MPLGEAEEGVRESTIYLVGTKDEKEELLRQAIALSEENEKEEDEEELLRQAIALSLEDWKLPIIMLLIFDAGYKM